MTDTSASTDPAPSPRIDLPAEAPALGPAFSTLAVDPAQPGPLWRQLLLQMQAMLGDGSLTQGMSLPTERDMADALGVSRITVKRCYDELRQQGVLAGRGRAGTVVQAAPPRIEPTLGRLKGFTEEMRELGMTASTRLVRLQVVQDRRIASIFGLPSSAQLLHVVRIRLGDALPMTREMAWYSLVAAPALADWDGSGSIYAWLQTRCQLQLSHADQTVEAVLSAPEEDRAFGYTTPQPCLLLKRRTFAQGATPVLVEYVEGTFRGDAYVYRTTLTV